MRTSSCKWAITAATLLSAATSASPTLPVFDPGNFINGAAIDHLYFPMTASGTRVYEGVVDGVAERFELTNLGAGPLILGVQTFIQLDRAYEDGLLVEETYDYYAQDVFGNVWYMGEDVTNYEYDDEDNLIDVNDESAWIAGQNFALPGFIMPADLTPGSEYYQEFAPWDAALDVGQTLTTLFELSLLTGDYLNVLAVLETEQTDPDARGIKYYVSGFGLIAEDEGVALDFMSYEARLQYVETVPVPAAAWLMLSALAGLLGVRRRAT